MREAMTEFELEAARRPRGSRRRGLSGLGLLLVVVGLLALAITYKLSGIMPTLVLHAA